MSTLTIPHKVLARGYRVRGAVGRGFQATIPYLTSWTDAFLFYDQLLGISTAITVGPISYTLPHRFPGSTSAILYCTGAEIEPCGSNGLPEPPDKGLVPGEFFTHAIVTADYETPTYIQTPFDDPGGINQLDPANPLTLVEQTLRSRGRTRTIKAAGYTFDDDSPVLGDIAKLEAETQLVLRFPRLPFLPWARVQPYLNCINAVPILGCDRGTLYLEEADSAFASTTQGLLGQQFGLSFTYQEFDWNKVENSSGVLSLVKKNGTSPVVGEETNERIYKYKDFRQLFW